MCCDPIPVFILSYERPLYLWAALDSLYRNTSYPHRFIICDNNSSDPLVRQVIQGFERRGMFSDVHFSTENDPNRLVWMLSRHRKIIGEYWAFCESDVLVTQSEPCWLTRLLNHMHDRPRLTMLGSRIDTSDFISVEDAQRIAPGLPLDVLAKFIKLNSPERALTQTIARSIISPFNPPGRLLLMRSSTLDTIPIQADRLLHEAMVRAGFETGIATDVVHRHLSLLNLYDYPNYDVALRDKYMATVRDQLPSV